MLTEKDYCDYDTCVAMKELGYNRGAYAYYFPNHKEVDLVFNTHQMRGCSINEMLKGYNTYPKDVMGHELIDAPTMWEAQKWLREEKNIIVEVFVDDDSDTPITYNIYKDGECVCHHHGKYWSVKEWSKALSEGIKEAVKLLKEKETL
jgi:hypothetical protein